MADHIGSEAGSRPRRRCGAEREALREQIIAAAWALFQEGGEPAVSMRTLARCVGLSPMALYAYFPTKAHLMRHVWTGILDAACLTQAALRGADLPIWERIDCCLRGFLSYWVDHPDHLQAILTALQQETRGSGLPSWFQERLIHLEELLRLLPALSQDAELQQVCRDLLTTQVLGTQMLLMARAEAPREARQQFCDRMACEMMVPLRRLLGHGTVVAG